MKFLRFCAEMWIRRFLAVVLCHAMCGVIRQYGFVRRGLVASGGSLQSTSSPAANIFLSLSALSSAVSSISPPRAVFINTVSGFISDNVSSHIKFLLSAVSGALSEMISDLLKKSSLLTLVIYSGSSL